MDSAHFWSILTENLSQIRPNATFLTIKKYKNNFGEVADHSVCFHINYKRAVIKSLKILKDLKISKNMIKGKFTLDHLKSAKIELQDSLEDSISGYNPRYTCHGVYSKILDRSDRQIAGIKLYLRGNVVHLEGYRINKRIYVRGNYSEVNSSPLTLAKNQLRQFLPVEKWGQFALCPGKFEELKVENLSILPKDTLRELNEKYNQ